MGLSLTYKRRLISFKKGEIRSFAFGPPPLAISLRPSPSAFGPHPSTLNLRPSTSGILPILFDWDTFVVEEKLQLQRRLTCWNFKYNIWPNTTKLIQQKGRRVPHR
ncbi:unnamed protein product [Prunus armeniaca]